MRPGYQASASLSGDVYDPVSVVYVLLEAVLIFVTEDEQVHVEKVKASKWNAFDFLIVFQEFLLILFFSLFRYSGNFLYSLKCVTKVSLFYSYFYFLEFLLTTTSNRDKINKKTFVLNHSPSNE